MFCEWRCRFSWFWIDHWWSCFFVCFLSLFFNLVLFFEWRSRSSWFWIDRWSCLRHWASSKSVGKSLEFCRRHQFCRQHFLILDSIKYKILQIQLRKQIQVMDVLHLFHRDWKVTFMWNFEELLCVLVPSEGIFRECQNYATTLWKARSKGKLCYQHPALAENKNRAEITSKSHSDEVSAT